MYEQGKTYTTRKGLQMSLAAHNGRPLYITRITVGDGIHPPDTDPRLLDGLISPKKNAGNLFAVMSDDKSQLRIQAVIDSAEVTQGFPITETGIFASDDEAEILFAVILNPDTPDYVWPETAGTKNRTNIDATITVVDADDVVVVNASEPYVTVSCFNEVVKTLKAEIAWLKAMLPVTSDTEPEDQPIGGIWHDIGKPEEAEQPPTGESVLVVLNSIVSQTEPEDKTLLWNHEEP